LRSAAEVGLDRDPERQLASLDIESADAQPKVLAASGFSLHGCYEI
jgi:hypothetical protein